MDTEQTADLAKLVERVKSIYLPDELRAKIDAILRRLSKLTDTGENYSTELDQVAHYVDWISSLPWNTTTKDILDLGHAKQVLDANHFGLEDLKQRILEYISVLIINEGKGINYHAPILLLVGLVGTGKTTLAKSICEALGRNFIRIPFGGMSSALDLRGQSRFHAESEPGQVIKNIRRGGSRNPVILLDEIDRVSPAAHGEIMGVLVELLDPEQNATFVDHYIDYPFDLSQALFIATANNTLNISTAVMDRLEPLMMPSYSDIEKITIARDYVLPKQIKSAGLDPETFKIDDALWPKIVRPLGFDSGIRTLERTIEGMVRKTAKIIVEKPGTQTIITEENLKQFLPTY